MIPTISHSRRVRGLVGGTCCECGRAAIADATHCVSYSDITAAISAPAQTKIRADPSRREALRERHAERDKLGEVRNATGVGGLARARSEAEI